MLTSYPSKSILLWVRDTRSEKLASSGLSSCLYPSAQNKARCGLQHLPLVVSKQIVCTLPGTIQEVGGQRGANRVPSAVRAQGRGRDSSPQPKPAHRQEKPSVGGRFQCRIGFSVISFSLRGRESSLHITAKTSGEEAV